MLASYQITLKYKSIIPTPIVQTSVSIKPQQCIFTVDPMATNNCCGSCWLALRRALPPFRLILSRVSKMWCRRCRRPFLSHKLNLATFAVDQCGSGPIMGETNYCARNWGVICHSLIRYQGKLNLYLKVTRDLLRDSRNVLKSSWFTTCRNPFKYHLCCKSYHSLSICVNECHNLLKGTHLSRREVQVKLWPVIDSSLPLKIKNKSWNASTHLLFIRPLKNWTQKLEAFMHLCTSPKSGL